jgi:hypothetical protein
MAFVIKARTANQLRTQLVGFYTARAEQAKKRYADAVERRNADPRKIPKYEVESAWMEYIQSRNTAYFLSDLIIEPCPCPSTSE